MAVPNPRTWVAGVTAFVAATMNLDLRDGLNFLLGRGATCKDYAKLTVTVLPTTTTGIALAVPFDSEEFDLRGGHSTSTAQTRYVAQEAGRYNIRGQLAFASNAVGARNAAVRTNGVTIIASSQFGPNPTQATMLPFNGDITLAAGDYIELIAYQQSGGNLLLYGLNGGTFMVVEWISV